MMRWGSVVAVATAMLLCGQQGVSGQPVQVNGIFPSLAVTADSAPVRTECGVGALLPWADKLYQISYLSTSDHGSGTGLYEISEDMTRKLLAPHNGTFANRMMHPPTQQIVIGPFLIDAHRQLRTITDLMHVRLGGMAQHLSDNNKVYFLSMDGPLFEVDISKGSNLKATQLFDLVKELHIPKAQGEQPHFKALHTMGGYLFAASNTFEEADQLGTQQGGRLAQWRGGNNSWEIVEHTAFLEITGRHNFGKVVYAVGWDNASAILMQRDFGDSAAPSSNTAWRRYRLPKASHAFDHLWQTEWPRIREVETERYLADIHGMFYELSPLGWAGSTWGLRPISQHIRVVPDYASFRGMLVLGGNEVSPINDANWVTGQAQSGLWFGKTDDLWSFGKPKGWGGPWRKVQVRANTPSDPFLMTGFDKKTLHITVDGPTPSQVSFRVEIDFGGMAGGTTGDPFVPYTTLQLAKGPSYAFHVFPEGFSAHWVRIVPSADCVATAIFHYS